MAENVLKLKKQAVALGMTKDAALRAGREELEKFIAAGGSKDKSESKPAKKKSKDSGENKPAKKKGKRKPKSNRETPAKRKPGRPAKAKDETPPKKPKAKPKADENGDSGRLAIGSLDWTATSEFWNPKQGGPVERLFKALKKAKGNIDKAFDALEGDMFDFVGKKKRDGSKRTKKEAAAMLRYRLNRTKFEFAVRTGQHESATERAEYGTGDYASTRRKKAPKSKPKAATKPKTKPKAKKRKKKS